MGKEVRDTRGERRKERTERRKKRHEKKEKMKRHEKKKEKPPRDDAIASMARETHSSWLGATGLHRRPPLAASTTGSRFDRPEETPLAPNLTQHAAESRRRAPTKLLAVLGFFKF